MYVKYPLSLRNVEDLLHERGIDICHETVRLWVDRPGEDAASAAPCRRTRANVDIVSPSPAIESLPAA